MQSIYRFSIKNDSSKVSPNLIYNNIKSNGKAFKIFDGIKSEFNKKKSIKYINKISKQFDGYTIECTIVTEVKAPIDVAKNGNYIFNNPTIDFVAEYYASHKLLEAYKRQSNIEGIKYELAKLYYMNYVIEKRLYHSKFITNRNKLITTRAKILNDFNTYIKIVLKKQPNFNFGEYYEASPFYANSMEVNPKSLGILKDLTKLLISTNALTVATLFSLYSAPFITTLSVLAFTDDTTNVESKLS